MPIYIVRIELHEKYKGEKIPQSELDDLHDLMSDWGGLREIVGSKGTYHLLPGMYKLEISNIFSPEDIRDALSTHLKILDRRKTIFVIKSSGMAWEALRKVRSK